MYKISCDVTIAYNTWYLYSISKHPDMQVVYLPLVWIGICVVRRNKYNIIT